MGALFGLIAAFLLYILPAIIARLRNHLSVNAIAIINLFFGWTIIGWIICLAWASSGYTKKNTSPLPNQISSGSENKKSNVLLIIFILFIGFCFFVSVLGSKKTSSLPQPTPVAAATVPSFSETAIPTSQPVAAATATSIPTVVPTPVSRWSYSQTDEKMGRGKIREAGILSSSTLEFGFPYAGAQRATFSIREHPKFGKDLILSIERGQFICNSYNGCKVTIRLDNGKPMIFSATPPADYSSDTIFIEGYSKVIKSLPTAKRMLVEANFYKEGNQVMEFDVQGFELPKM